jgi:integrase
MGRAQKWIGTWEGGRTYRTQTGEVRWVIRRRLGDKDWNVTLDVEKEADANAEYRVFQRDPAAYRTHRQELSHRAKVAAKAAQEAVLLTDATVEPFLRHLKATGRTPQYIDAAQHYLADWGTKLKGQDLRTIGPKALKKTHASFETALKWRTITFKSFCSYLVAQGDLDAVEDPGRHLRVPAARRRHENKSYSIETVERLYKAIPSQEVRDVLCILAKTGMHGTEVERLARGDGTLTALKGHGEIAGTARFIHKNGRPFIVSLDLQTLAAAQRLQARRKAPDRQTLRHYAHRVHKATGLEVVNFGALRHSFATWMAQSGTICSPGGAGVSAEVVAQLLGHTSARTTALHYLDVKVPPMGQVPIKLYHPEDPKPLAGARSGSQTG